MKKYSIKELVKKIQDKEISCVEVVDYYIKEIENGTAYSTLGEEEKQALQKAISSDEE